MLIESFQLGSSRNRSFVTPEGKWSQDLQSFHLYFVFRMFNSESEITVQMEDSM